MKRMRLVMLPALLMIAVALAWADPFPGIPAKWSRLPDMTTAGKDILSIHQANGPVVSDWFFSNGMPIVGFRWWGSYLDPAQAPPPGQQRQLYFEISFHDNCPAGTDCDPGAGVKTYTFDTPMMQYTYRILPVWENYWGSIHYPDGTLKEHVYEYWVLLPDWWEETAGNVYWADFALDQGRNPGQWGWHTSPSISTDRKAVQTLPPSPGNNPHMGPWQRLDCTTMAFEVLTIPEPASLLLIGAGLLLLGTLARRQRK